ncbi:MAG: hypothetical protein ACXVA9_07295 [Bdellovibrionales bacterium]
MAKHKIQLRFNTEKEKIDGTLPPWRVLVDGVEHLATAVRVEVPTWTSEDLLPNGQRKWHISCEGDISWDKAERTCTIR